VRKARAAGKFSAADAAEAAGLSETELGDFEREGRAPRDLNWPALGRLLGMNAQKLQDIANGWTPAEPDLNRWQGLIRIVTTGEGMDVNAYLVWDEATRLAALFDTGFDAAPIFDLLKQNGLDLRHIFLTHLHHDHVLALDDVRRQFPGACVHASAGSFTPMRGSHPGDAVRLGSLSVAVRPTPGHSPEGASYIVSGWADGVPDVAFVGDALFAGSIGRGMQSWLLARAKVEEQILSLPPQTLVGPGHGPWTTVGEELERNPFF